MIQRNPQSTTQAKKTMPLIHAAPPGQHHFSRPPPNLPTRRRPNTNLRAAPCHRSIPAAYPYTTEPTPEHPPHQNYVIPCRQTRSHHPKPPCRTNQLDHLKPPQKKPRPSRELTAPGIRRFAAPTPPNAPIPRRRSRSESPKKPKLHEKPVL